MGFMDRVLQRQSVWEFDKVSGEGKVVKLAFAQRCTVSVSIFGSKAAVN